MADLGIRDLERAVAAGDEGARLPLAAAYLRRGQAPAALAVLGQLDAGEADDLEATAWAEALIKLRPAAKVPGARLYHALQGWSDGRYAALRVHQTESFVVFDRGRGELLPIHGLPQPTRLHGVARAGLLCMQRGNALLLHLENGDWRPERLPVAEGAPISLSDDNAWLLSRSGGLVSELRVSRLPEGRPGRLIHASRFAFDWDLDLVVVATGTGGHLQMASLRGEEPARTVVLHRGVDDVPELFTLLGDGRLLTGNPPALFDPASPGPLRILSHSPVRGLVRLSRDGQALLCVQAGQPARLPLRGSARTAQAFGDPGEPCHWHPRADLTAWGGRQRQAELLAFAPGAARGRVVLRLPRGLWPLGWTPDGLGLLLVRELTGMSGILELWTSEGSL